MIDLISIIAEASIKPKKNARKNDGYVISKWFISFANVNIAKNIPPKSETKKLPFIAFQTCLIFHLNKSFKVVILNAYKASINSS